jgi:DNA topoisomerase-1
VIRFSRKLREHYVQSEEEGKPTGWRAVYASGRWQVESGPAPAEPRAGARSGAASRATAGTKTGARASSGGKTGAGASGGAKTTRKAPAKRKST